jgi:hypothetical protein
MFLDFTMPNKVYNNRLLFWQVTNNKTGLAMQIFNLAEFLRDAGLGVAYASVHSSIYRNNNRCALNEYTIERIMRDPSHDAAFEVITRIRIKRNKDGRKTHKHVTYRSGVIA